MGASSKSNELLGLLSALLLTRDWQKAIFLHLKPEINRMDFRADLSQ